MTTDKNFKKSCKVMLLCMAIATVTMLAASFRTSPFFDFVYGDFNGNHVSDAMLVGKYWLQGMIPYKDLFLMGGPLYYLVQAVGWLIGNRCGVLLLQIVGLTVTLYFLHEIGSWFLNTKLNWLLTLFMVFPYASIACGGDSAAEWCLPLETTVVYVTLKYSLLRSRSADLTDADNTGAENVNAENANIENADAENGNAENTDVENADATTRLSADVTSKDLMTGSIEKRGKVCLWIGILTGCLLCMDIRCAIVPFVAAIWYTLNRKNGKAVLKLVVGIAIPVVLFIAYFAAAGGLKDLWRGAFLFPVEWFIKEFGSVSLLIHKFVKSCLYLPAAIAVCFGCHRKVPSLKNAAPVLLVMSIAGFLSGLFGSGEWMFYLPALPLLFLGLAMIASDLSRSVGKVFFALGVLAIIAVCVLPFKDLVSYLAAGPDLANTEFRDDLEGNLSADSSLTFLSLDTESTFFLMEDIKPSTKYFAEQTALSVYDSSILTSMDEAIAGAVPADILLITERGYIGRELDLYTNIQVYLKIGGSIFIYTANQ